LRERLTRHDWDPKTLANPKSTRAGDGGWRGRSPLPGGLGDVLFRPNPWPPSLRGKGESLAGFSWPGERLTPKTLADPQLTRLGNGGGGGTAPSQGVWEMCPHKFKRGSESPTLATRPRGGPKRWQTQSQRGWENGGPGGRSPHGGGLWGVSPHETKRGDELPTLATRPRVGPKTLANPQPTRVGNGAQGAKPPPRGPGGCAPKIFKLMPEEIPRLAYGAKG
jgi:hypothetical protein